MNLKIKHFVIFLTFLGLAFRKRKQQKLSETMCKQLPKLSKETKPLDLDEIATCREHDLKVGQACELVICLSLLGHSHTDQQRLGDMELARTTKHTQRTIGGHTRTFLERPPIRQNSNGADILVNQMVRYGNNPGRMAFYFEDSDNIATDGTLNFGIQK